MHRFNLEVWDTLAEQAADQFRVGSQIQVLFLLNQQCRCKHATVHNAALHLGRDSSPGVMLRQWHHACCVDLPYFPNSCNFRGRANEWQGSGCWQQVVGRLKNDQWTDREGQTRNTFKIVADQVNRVRPWNTVSLCRIDLRARKLLLFYSIVRTAAGNSTLSFQQLSPKMRCVSCGNTSRHGRASVVEQAA